MEYIDISPPLHSELAVFPGDTPFLRQEQLSCDRGDHIGLSSLHTTAHIGAHADAPSHYGAGQKSVEELDLAPYMGRCQVIRVSMSAGERIYPKDIESYSIQAPRILFATESFVPSEWNSNFNSLSPELLEALADQGVSLVGIDTPSVDPAESKALESHRVLLKRNIRVLEGLWLKEVPQGLYNLLALPLPIKDGDASPVRALLLPRFTEIFQW